MNAASVRPTYRHSLGEWLPESLLLLVVLALLVCTLTACATVDARSTQYLGAPHPPPTDPAQVAILREPPTRPHDGLGEVVVDASTQPAPPIEQIEDKLRVEAAKLGAEAVVIMLDRVQPIGMYVSGPYVDPVMGRRIVGIAIKYRA